MTDRRTSTKAMRALADFFIKNPTEELSIEDAAAKIGSGLNYAAVSLSSLVGSGVLERFSVYRLRRPDESAPDTENVSPDQRRASAPTLAPPGQRQAEAPGEKPSRLESLIP